MSESAAVSSDGSAQVRGRKHVMGVFTLSMVNVATVLSIVNFPAQAEYGCAIIFYITASAVCFFIPIALVSAELAAAFPENGGMYLWVKEAFGEKWGFVTVFMQWLNTLPWYATVLTFIATTSAYITNPALSHNRLYVYCVIVGTMWLCTLLNCRGIRFYAKMSTFGVLIGTLFPAVIIIGLAAAFLTTGHKPEITFSWRALVPNLDSLNQWMLLAGMMVSLAGIDMPAVHVTDVENPRVNFPKAILISSVMIIVFSILGSLSISLIVPPETLSMASGAAEAFSRMLDVFRLGWFAPMLSILLIIGALTTVITWTLGPAKGLLQVAEDGCIPSFWRKVNSYGVPTRILFMQALIPSLISLVIFVMPTIGGAFWVMMALSSQLYMLMYLFMFSAALYLRYSRPALKRPYKVPFGNPGMILICALGMGTSLLAMAAGFIPPASIRSQSIMHILGYVVFIFFGTYFFLLAALGLLRLQKRYEKNDFFG